MRMVLEYHGRRVSGHPSSYKAEFEPPMHRPIRPLPDTIILPDATVMVAPYEWHQYGMPTTQVARQLLCEITGFRPINSRPAFGRWTTEDVEELLRAHGPFLFIGNWNRQGSHAVLVVGRVRSGVEGERIDEVLYIDPAGGEELAVSIGHFNRQMSSVGDDPTNPLYLPTRRPVRAVVPIEASLNVEHAQHAGLLDRGVLTGATQSTGAIRGGSRRPGPIGLA